MASTYANYLAAGILSDGRVITYRLLSRALKVHVNIAKEMMFEFHRIQNGKKPGTVHATYLLSGTKRRAEPTITVEHHVEKDGDTYMQSSPYMGSSMPVSDEFGEEEPVQTIILAREEHLEEVRNQFENITSIHVYSLEPHPLKDLHILSDITRELRELTATEDPQEHGRTYGTIQNKNVKRRKTRGPPPPAAVLTPAAVAKVKSTNGSQAQVDKSNDENKSQATSAKAKKDINPEKVSAQLSAAKDFFAKKDADKKAATSVSETKSSDKNSTQKKSNSIFASFAKAKPKLKKEDTDTSAVDFAASAQASEHEDSPMKDVSDDEDDEVIPDEKAKAAAEKVRRDRMAREASLLRAMDEDDDDEPAAPTPAAEPDEPIDAMEVDKPEEEPKVVVEGGRRRGKRKVMKKKTIKDEEGYLVTKEEAVWESFSEEEPAAPKLPSRKPPVSSSAATGKAKKAAAKPGQGNIMSFFGKK